MGAVATPRINEAQRNIVLVAGEESVGRPLRLRSLIAQEHIPGRLTDFRRETGEHQFRAHDGEEEWVVLANRAYQWTAPVSSNARPNPTFVHFPGNHEAIGWKVRVYWNEMGKWYTGRVRAYDQVKGRHEVRFFDGDVRWYVMRDEAVVWLQKLSTVKQSANGITGTAPEGSETEMQRMRRPKSNGKTANHKDPSSMATSTSSSS